MRCATTPSGQTRAGPKHYWQILLNAGPEGITVRDMTKQCRDRTYATVHSYVRFLRDNGYVAAVGKEPSKRNEASHTVIYAVVRRVSRAPTQRRSSSAGPRGRATAQLWNAMRGLSTFMVRELAAVASTEDLVVDPGFASRYVKTLFRSGLLLAVRPYRMSYSGRRGVTPAVYKLRPAANTGPLAPAIISGKVFDQNLEVFVSEPAEVPA